MYKDFLTPKNVFKNTKIYLVLFIIICLWGFLDRKHAHSRNIRKFHSCKKLKISQLPDSPEAVPVIN